MTILTKPAILKAVKKKEIVIKPYDPSCVGPGSIDLTLDRVFRVFIRNKKTRDATTTDYKTITRLVRKTSIVLKPQETILGITQEKISLSPNLCGWLEGRTRFARLGLLIHISASFIQPGVSNQQVLEISNMGHTPLRLKAGMKICQFVFQRTEGRARYAGAFKAQTEP